MNRFLLAMRIIFKKKDPNKVKAAEESARVIALKRQVETLQAINETYAEQVQTLSNQLANHKETDMQEKMLNMAMQMFTKPQTTISDSSVGSLSNKSASEPLNNSDKQRKLTNLESGIQYSDADLISIAQTLPPETMQLLKGMAKEQFAEVLKSQVSNISDESIERARTIMEMMT